VKFYYNYRCNLKCVPWITVNTLLRKLKAASKEVESMKGPFEELSSSLNQDQLKLWMKEAEKADNERGEALDVYNLRMDKGLSSHSFFKILLLIIILSLL
jgi:hypothetical protein